MNKTLLNYSNKHNITKFMTVDGPITSDITRLKNKSRSAKFAHFRTCKIGRAQIALSFVFDKPLPRAIFSLHTKLFIGT